MSYEDVEFSSNATNSNRGEIILAAQRLTDSGDYTLVHIRLVLYHP